MAEQNKSLYRDGLTVMDFRQQVASFVTEAMKVGIKIPLDQLHIDSEEDRNKAVAQVTTALGGFFIEYIELVPEDVDQELLDDIIEGAYRLFDLFLVKGKYDILRGAEPVSVLHTMMVVMLIASLEGLQPVTDFSVGSTANSLFHALDEQDCKDPVFLYHRERYMAGAEEVEEDGNY